MAVKVYKPTSAGRRISSGDSFADITKVTPEKSLTRPAKKHSGRNNSGKITVRHRGGGHKRRYRTIDFRQTAIGSLEVMAIEYDPNRSSRIALVQNVDGEKSYIVAADGMKVGQTIRVSATPVDLQSGNRMPLKFIPSGTAVHNLEYIPGQGGMIVRSAGSSAAVMSVDAGFVQIKLPSGEIRKFPEDCFASVGKVSNPDWGKIRWGKAGRMRYRGIKPTVRGKAMNPVDHPHGGGEGNQPIGLKHPKTPQGKPALGVKTRRANKRSDAYIVSPRKKSKRR